MPSIALAKHAKQQLQAVANTVPQATTPAAPGGRHGFTRSASCGLSKNVVRMTAADTLSLRCSRAGAC